MKHRVTLLQLDICMKHSLVVNYKLGTTVNVVDIEVIISHNVPAVLSNLSQKNKR